MSYGDSDENKYFTVIYPFQDVLMKMTECLRNQEYAEYVDLVEHLRNMTILTFVKEDVENIAKIEDVVEGLKLHIDTCFKQKLSDATLYRVEDANKANWDRAQLKGYCEFLFYEVIERICIHALRKSIFSGQVRSSQQSDVFDAVYDCKRTLKKANGVLKSCGVAPFEVSV